MLTHLSWQAVDIIKWMGVEPEIRKHATHEEGVAFVRWNGRPIGTFKATGRSDIQSLTSEYEIFRGGLAKIFIEPVMGRVNLIFNETADHYTQDADGVHVTFGTYDLLVAADGLGSRLRGSLINTSLREQIHDEGVYAAYFTIKKDLLKGSRIAKLNQALEKGNESYMQLIEELYRDEEWLTPEVLQGMREIDDFYCTLFAQVQCPKLCDRRVVLLGDAGYATPGLGTSLAITGGYVLAGELLSHSGDITTALAQYEKLLLGFVKAS
ncbi:hypothetical protein LTR08_000439 [Meristemomyces frigidus]|nr:hypothetical protein LTR08_000439 [Meristemomyces frigidus]